LTGILKREVGGKNFPEIILPSLGKLDYDSNLSLNSEKAIIFNFSISDINPKIIPNTGGSYIKIQGKNFPSKSSLDGKSASDIGLKILIGKLPCIIHDFDYEEIVCVAPKKNINDIITIEFSNLIQEDNKTNNLFSYDSTINYPGLVSVEPNKASPGEKKFIYITFDNSISKFIKDKNDLIVELRNKSNNQIYNLFIVDILEEGNKIKIRYSGAPLGKYEITVKANENTNFNSNLDFNIHITITSISPNEGSIEGGTLVNIKGENFLTEKLNQIVYIKNLICNYVNVTNTEINCLTSPAPVESRDIPYTLVVDQLLQYESQCNDIKNNCIFKYSTQKTSIVHDIRLLDKKFNLNDLNIKSKFNIYGENLYYPYFPYILDFDWGKISIESSDIDSENYLNFSAEKKIIVLSCKLIEIKNYVTVHLNFYDFYGLSQMKNSRTGQNYFLISLVYPNPQLISFKPTNAILKQGAMFELEFDDVKGFIELTKFRNSHAILNICDKICNLYLESDNNNNKNTNFNDFYKDPSLSISAKNNILRCKFADVELNPFIMHSLTNFTNCNLKITHYYNDIVTNINLPKINLVPEDKHITVSSIFIDNVDYTTNLANLIDIAKNIIRFDVDFMLFDKDIPKENLDIKLILNDNLIFLSSRCQTDTRIDPTTNADTYFYSCNFVVNTDELTHGVYDVYFYLTNFGYLELPGTYNYNPFIMNTAISFKISIPMLVNNDKIQNIQSSFNGGKVIKIPVLNLESNFKDTLKRVLICGLPTKIINYDNVEGMTFKSIGILKTNLNFANFTIENHSIELNKEESLNLNSIPFNKDELQKLSDGNPYTFFEKLEKFGININKEVSLGFKLFVNYITIQTTETLDTNSLLSSVIE